MLGARADWDGVTGRDNAPVLQELIAWAQGRPIRFRTGRYLCSTITISGPAVLIGQGAGKTTLVQADTKGLGGRGMLFVGSGQPADVVSGLRFEDMAFDGSVDKRGFEQFTHLVSLNGVEAVDIRRVAFLGFRGDGLYIGSGLDGNQRHNRNVRVSDCHFDGRNRNNRNGISVLDVDGLVIDRCSFMRCSRADMPGAIDFEPDVDSSAAVIRNVQISNNRFRDVGGGVATICFHFAPKLQPPEQVRIANNTASHGGRAFLYMNVMRTSARPPPDQGVVVTGNVYRQSSGGPFLLEGVTGLRLSANTWSDLGSAAQVGTLRRVRNLAVADRFTRVGSVITPYALGVAQVSGLDLQGTRFTDCGSPVAGGENIYFRAANKGLPARSDHVSLAGAISQASSRHATPMTAVSPLHARD